MTMRATQTSLNPQRKNLCRRLLHAARHRHQTQIRYTLIMQALVVNRPKKLSDTAEIAELYKNKTTVILMLNNTNKDIATRIIDFLGGVSYITGGEIKRIADTTYVLAPYNVDISGEFIDEISSISGEDIFDDLD